MALWKRSFKSIKIVIVCWSLGLSLSVVANDPIGTPEGRVVREAESRLIPLSRTSYSLNVPFFKPAFAHASSADSVTIPSDHKIAFVHAAVLTMLSEEVFTDYTVVVQNGLIIDLGPSDLVAIPSGAITIDATGKWLMPGLADMHTHVNVEGDLLVYLANGVTSILNMGNDGVDLLAMREKVRSGLLIGPTIYTASLTGGPGDQFSPSFTVSTESKARQHVQLSKAQGYEYIKVYDHLAPDLFYIVLEEASAWDMPVVGHARIAPGIEFMLNAGLVMVAHLEEYLWGFFIDEQTFSWDPTQIPDAIAFTLANQATVTTTLSVNEIRQRSASVAD